MSYIPAVADPSSGSVSSPTAVAAAGGGIPYKPQIIATRACIPNSPANFGYARAQSRLKIQFPNAYVSQVQFGAAGFRVTGGASGGETVLGTVQGYDSLMENALEVISPNSFATLYCKGEKQGAIPDGTPFSLTDPLNGFVFPPNSFAYARHARISQSLGQNIPYNQTGSGPTGFASGDTGEITPSTFSQIYRTGNITLDSGAVSFGACPPALILGIPSTPVPAVLHVGDSIDSGAGETSDSSLGSTGFMQRGLENIGGGVCVPSVKYAASGLFLSTVTYANMPRLWSYIPFCTHFVQQAVTNDIGNGASLASMQALILAQAAAVKKVVGPYGKPVKFYVAKCLPRTTSGNNFIDALGQTFVAGYTVGGIRDQFNDWLDTQVGVTIDGTIDPNVYAEDPANHGKWVTNGAAFYPTVDGIHPSTAVNILMAQTVAAWGATLTV